jgi:hypothetical protein
MIRFQILETQQVRSVAIRLNCIPRKAILTDVFNGFSRQLHNLYLSPHCNQINEDETSGAYNMGEMRNAYKILVINLKEEKLRHIGLNYIKFNIKIDLKYVMRSRFIWHRPGLL